MNNVIGREVGIKSKSNNMRELAIETLDSYYKNGFWVVKEQSNGYYSIVMEKITTDQYQKAYDRIIILDEHGFTKEQRDKLKRKKKVI